MKLPTHREIVLPSLSDQSFEQIHDRLWSKTTLENDTSPGVRFSHNIIQVEYLPESPVRSSFGDHSGGPLDMAYYDSECDSVVAEAGEALEDGILWSFVADTGLLVQYFAQNCWTQLARCFVQPHTGSVTPKKHGKLVTSEKLHLPFATKELFGLLLSAAKSTASLAATWVAYQSLLPIAWFVEHPSFRSSPKKESSPLVTCVESLSDARFRTTAAHA